MIPGEMIAAEGEIEINPGRERTTLTVANRGDRPVQVGAHSHLFEVNDTLAFDREAAYGKRLDIPAGTALRFEPGEAREVVLVPFVGGRTVYGLNARVQGPLAARRAEAIAELAEREGER